MKQKIENAIKDYENKLFYGRATIELTDKWNYSIFKRDDIIHDKNSMKFNYSLAIVRENYVEEELIFNIIDKILSNTNLKLRDTNFKFDYFYNQKSDIVCETVVIEFYRSTKVCYENK